MHVRTGLDLLIEQQLEPLVGKRVAVVCNQATIASDYRHILQHLLSQEHIHLQAILGPQHGLWGHTQDNMIEWEGANDARLRVPIYSLYGEHREPTHAMLHDVELLVLDLPDIGSRYYTFTWTMALCIKACELRGIPIIVLDRPNPIGGNQVEGTVLDPEFASFVGLHPLPIRHGMTIGEIATYLVQTFYRDADLTIVKAENWKRSEYFEQTKLPWAMPSPNMPIVDTAFVYPGGCLLEATNISEGRGTTRPFETLGAPFVDGWKLADALNDAALPGVYFRPIQFQPTFNKHAGQTCEGVFIHVTSRAEFKPFITYIAVLQELAKLNEFQWKPPPYEYEFTKLPIDILAGNAWLRPAIENRTPLLQIEARCQAELDQFEPTRQIALLY